MLSILSTSCDSSENLTIGEKKNPCLAEGLAIVIRVSVAKIMLEGFTRAGVPGIRLSHLKVTEEFLRQCVHVTNLEVLRCGITLQIGNSRVISDFHGDHGVIGLAVPRSTCLTQTNP